jgi:crossover junction endodeoxyribonuclease RuvC
VTRPRQERILGIDPGTAATGFAVIDRVGNRLTAVWYDCLRTTPKETPGARLLRIGTAVREALVHLKPDVVAIEELFFGANARSALAVGQARGVCIHACAEAGLEVHEYSPATVKQAVTGYGQADKEQVQRMVQQILRMTEPPRPDHCADAFAIAVTHASSMSLAHR